METKDSGFTLLPDIWFYGKHPVRVYEPVFYEKMKNGVVIEEYVWIRYVKGHKITVVELSKLKKGKAGDTLYG